VAVDVLDGGRERPDVPVGVFMHAADLVGHLADPFGEADDDVLHALLHTGDALRKLSEGTIGRHPVSQF
jgi:hypothetical protein